MDAAKITTLKRKLIEATDFTEILDYYFEELGNDPVFAMSGEPMNDKRFLAAFAQVALKVAGAKKALLHGTPVRVAEHRLVHGAFTLGKWTLMMFYFEDVEQGFLALGEEGPDVYARFTLAEPPNGTTVMLH